MLWNYITLKLENKMNFNRFLIIIGFAIWIIETVYFGFNIYAITDAEKFCDRLSFSLIFVGLLLNIIRLNININKKMIKENQKTKKS